MGKGDIKTGKGKITNGSYGVRRPKNKARVNKTTKATEVTNEELPKAETAQ